MKLSIEDLSVSEFECAIFPFKRKPIIKKTPTIEFGEKIILSTNPTMSNWFTAITRANNRFTLIELINIPCRHHRKKRIQKKWIKRYGYKEIYRKEFDFKKVEKGILPNDELDAMPYSARLIKTEETNHGKRSIYVPPLC